MYGRTISTATGLNRLTEAGEPDRDPQQNLRGWTEANGYDRWGNRWVASQTGLPPLTVYVPQSANVFVNPATAVVDNRNHATGVAHDDSGNVTQLGVQALDYDGENRLTRSTWNGVYRFTYDGEGRRVKMEQVDPNNQSQVIEGRVYVYDAQGQLPEEYPPETGTAPVDPCPGISYLTADHLGSTRLITDGAGAVRQRIDYLPFGGEVPLTVNGRSSVAGYDGCAGGTRVKFTGKERDAETGLDYCKGVRYRSP